MTRHGCFRRVAAGGLCALAMGMLAAPAGAATFTFNGGQVTMPLTNVGGPGAPYPSAVPATGLTQPVGKVRVTLNSLTHYWLEDLDILLIGPGGQRAMLFSDACAAGSGLNVAGNYTVDDDAAATAPALGPCSGGTFKPSDYEVGETMPGAAPGGPYPASLAGFNGISGNGTWQLYLADDMQLTDGSIAGWTLELTEQAPATPAPPGTGSSKKCKKKAASAKKKKCRKKKKKKKKKKKAALLTAAGPGRL